MHYVLTNLRVTESNLQLAWGMHADFSEDAPQCTTCWECHSVRRPIGVGAGRQRGANNIESSKPGIVRAGDAV
jgi:hypothetical protein